MPSPAVAVVIPAYNAASLLPAALCSVAEQTWQDLEVIVVDDASEDDTHAIVRAHGDARVRYLRNPRNEGQSRTANRGLRETRAELVKFLDADDTLAPDCLEQFVALFRSRTDMGLAFSRRHVELEDPSDPGCARWKRDHGEPHQGFANIKEVNAGSALFEQLLATGFSCNWIGEPSNVMVRRDCLRSSGTFGVKPRQTVDLDLWIRAMHFGDVGFIKQPLSTYRFGRDGVTKSVMERSGDWLDTLWSLEGLASLGDVWRRYPALRALRRQLVETKLKDALRAACRGRLRREQTLDLAEYAGYRALAVTGRAPRLFGEVG